jgi:hypothetical protein
MLLSCRSGRIIVMTVADDNDAPHPDDAGPPVDRAASSDIGSVLLSLKEIVSIVMGLALTNSVLALITNHHYTSVLTLSALPLSGVLYTLVLIMNIVRFYHGNMRHMDSLYGVPARKLALSTHGSLGSLGVDFSVVFLESVVFAVISFYAGHRADFVLLFLILLAIDLLWNIVTLQEGSEARDVSHQRGWMVNNVLAVVALLALYFGYQNHHHDLVLLHVAVGVVALNTVIDFAISWKFYFPMLGVKAVV